MQDHIVRLSHPSQFWLKDYSGAGCRYYVENVFEAFDTPGQWYTWTIPALVEAWLNDPSSNNGLIIKGRDGPNVQFSISSSDSPYQNLHPFLTISYRLPDSAQRKTP